MAFPSAHHNVHNNAPPLVFFTHCHPARAIIHKPNFSAALSHNRVPSYLLHAVCALAAPLSKQPRIRTTPSRYAGKPFAQEALSLMFDGAGRLVCEPNLATAQALSLLQMHDILVKDKNVLWNSRYHGKPPMTTWCLKLSGTSRSGFTNSGCSWRSQSRASNSHARTFCRIYFCFDRARGHSPHILADPLNGRHGGHIFQETHHLYG